MKKTKKSWLIVLVLVLLITVSTIDMQTIIGGTSCYRGSSVYDAATDTIRFTFEDNGGYKGVMGEQPIIRFCDTMRIENMDEATCALWGLNYISTSSIPCTAHQSSGAISQMYIQDFTGTAALSDQNPMSQNTMGLFIGSKTADLVNPVMQSTGDIKFDYIVTAPVHNYAVQASVTDQKAFGYIWSKTIGSYTLSLTEPCTVTDNYEYCQNNIVYSQVCMNGKLDTTQKLVCGGSTVCQIGVDGVGICTSDVNGDAGLDIPLWLVGGLFMFIAVMVFAFFRGKMKR